MISLMLVVMLATPVHWEDPLNCMSMIKDLKDTKTDQWKTTYEGLSEDARDYIIRSTREGDTLKVEEHYQLLPQSQWASPEEPTYLKNILSLWLDFDGDGHYNEWYLFPRGRSNCQDALHFIWDHDLQTYKLYATGKERT